MKYKSYLLLFLLIILSFFSGCQSVNTMEKTATAGTLDLTAWDFSKDEIIQLDGEWAFYWMKLLSPENPLDKASLTGYYDLPVYWFNYKEIKLPVKGYATYRLKVKLDGRERILSMSVPEVYSEYKLWINGELHHDNISTPSHRLIYIRPRVYDFCVDGNELDIILQIKNYNHINAGISRSIQIGESSSIHKEQNLSFSLDFLSSTICFLAGIYHIILFISRRKNKESIYFSFLCFIIGIRTILSHDIILMDAFPDLSFYYGLKITTLTIPFGIIAMILYTRELFREDVPDLLIKLNFFIHIPYALFTIFCYNYLYFQFFIPYLCGVIITCLSGLYVSIMIVKNRRPEYLFYVTGVALLVFGTISEILTFVNITDTKMYVSYSLVFFVIIQTILIAKRYMHATRHIEILSSDLEQSLYQIEDTQNAFLNAQIKPHFLYNTLNTIAQCCQTEPEEAEKLILYLSKYLRGTLSFENLGNAIPLRKEVELVSAYCYIEKVRFNKITIEMDIDDLSLDYLVPPLLLQPLIENAIKHGIRKKGNSGIIKLSIKYSEASLLFTIEDNGIGIPPERLEKLLKQPSDNNSIGLFNIHIRLLRLYGKGLTLQSTVGEGTIVSFEIPLE